MTEPYSTHNLTVADHEGGDENKLDVLDENSDLAAVIHGVNEQDAEVLGALFTAAPQMRDALAAFPEREEPLDVMDERVMVEYLDRVEAWRLDVQQAALDAARVKA